MNFILLFLFLFSFYILHKFLSESFLTYQDTFFEFLLGFLFNPFFLILNFFYDIFLEIKTILSSFIEYKTNKKGN
mgnify:CR=1 FL=1